MSGFSLRSLLSFLPFGYQAITRLNGWRDFAYLVASSWIPAAWIAARTSDLPACETLLGFVAGYLAFISIYELGYLANDAWDARRHADGRHRIPFPAAPLPLALFTFIRLASWMAIGISFGWAADPVWLAGFAALVAGIAIHNLLRSPALRLASFAQLAVLRFLLPVAAMMTAAGWTASLLCAVLTYLPLRFLSYADSKGLLAMQERRRPWFAASYIAVGMPLFAFAAWVFDAGSFLESAIFLLAAHAAWALLSTQARGAKR